MKCDHTVLSLDPMYSPLHEKIAQLTSKKKYALTSCYAKKIYLPSFKQFLIVDLIKSISKEQARSYHQKVASLKTIHHAYVQKVEKRGLSNEELNYMARFYIALKSFILDKGVSLVVVHNESRWYHSVAVALCKELKVPYLVTEQGVIRPNTTVVDPQGCNANSKIEFDFSIREKSFLEKKQDRFTPKYTHDSFKSMCFFLFFIFLFTLERANKSRTIVRYMHNNYSLRKYSKRILRKFFNRTNNSTRLRENEILLLLQLETDSQFLLHSPYTSNQEVIDLVSNIAYEGNYNLAIKFHPIDENKYVISERVNVVDGKVTELAKMAKAVFTINSSASVDVIKTDTPLIMMGESIYQISGVASRYETAKQLSHFELDVNMLARRSFLAYLQNEYLLDGAGYSFCLEELKNRLARILD